MNVYVAMNWGAWAVSALLFGWLINDFFKTQKTYSEAILLGTVDQDDVEGQNN